MDNTIKQHLTSIIYELEQLAIKTEAHIEERASSNRHVYADTYRV